MTETALGSIVMDGCFEELTLKLSSEWPEGASLWGRGFQHTGQDLRGEAFCSEPIRTARRGCGWSEGAKDQEELRIMSSIMA